ncbi:MAG: FAD-dependent oxidoreductase, partial [Deltaproteobacteria bacterium]|nr:FAD-dependent oxidoreductase [Deltaproteobacteria bacterium]
EKAGLLVGHTEAICTGTLAGCNAVRHARRDKPLVLPDSLAVGDAIRFVRQQMREEGILSLKYTYSGSVYFERMKARGLYTTDRRQVEQRVGAAGMTMAFSGH